MTWLMWLKHYVDAANARDFIKPCFYTTHFAFVYFAVQIMINERTITTILHLPTWHLAVYPSFPSKKNVLAHKETEGI